MSCFKLKERKDDTLEDNVLDGMMAMFLSRATMHLQRLLPWEQAVQGFHPEAFILRFSQHAMPSHDDGLMVCCMQQMPGWRM